MRGLGAVRGIALGGAIAAVMSSCIVREVNHPRLTGTCAGACDHYIACKPGHPERDRARCQRECPDAFGDPDSIRQFESLSCKNTVEYVDGTSPRSASHIPAAARTSR